VAAGVLRRGKGETKNPEFFAEATLQLGWLELEAGEHVGGRADPLGDRVGVVAPNGIGADAWWNATQAGTSGIGRITLFDPSQYPAQLAGEVDGFDAADYIDQRMIVQTDRWTHLALAAFLAGQGRLSTP